ASGCAGRWRRRAWRRAGRRCGGRVPARSRAGSWWRRYSRACPSQFFHHDVAVGIDADVAGDVERFGGDRLRIQFGVRSERARGRQRIRPAGADRDDAVFGLDHVAGTADDQRGFLVGDDQQRLELAEAPFGAPLLGQLYRGARELAVLLELGLEQFEQGEGIGRRAGEAGQHLAIAAEAAHLARVGFHDGVAESDLAIAGDGDMAIAAHRDDGGGVEDVGVAAGIHGFLRGVPPNWGRGGAVQALRPATVRPASPGLPSQRRAARPRGALQRRYSASYSPLFSVFRFARGCAASYTLARCW